MWTKPEAVEMRYGFEICMYIANRSSDLRESSRKLGLFLDLRKLLCYSKS